MSVVGNIKRCEINIYQNISLQKYRNESSWKYKMAGGKNILKYSSAKI